MTIAKQNNTKLAIAIIVAILFIYAIAQTLFLFSNSDKECVEWGVIKKNNRTGKEEWATTNRTPKDQDDADQIAKELEAGELTARYDYKAKCKRYKGD